MLHVPTHPYGYYYVSKAPQNPSYDIIFHILNYCIMTTESPVVEDVEMAAPADEKVGVNVRVKQNNHGMDREENKSHHLPANSTSRSESLLAATGKPINIIP